MKFFASTAFKIWREESSIDDVIKEFLDDVFSRNQQNIKKIKDEVRYQHLLAVGRTGCGKSSVLFYLMAQDIPKCLAGLRTMIYIDPVNGCDELLKSTGIWKSERVIYIDVSDPDSMPYLNLFETGRKRDGILGTSHMINTFKSICSGLIDQEMTPNMMNLFGYCARIMMYLDAPTLHDLYDLLIDPIGYMGHLDVPEDDPAYRFFAEDVGTLKQKGAYFDTVKYVRGRVHGFINDPIIERLLVNRNPTLSMAKAIEKGTIILVSTRKADLGEDGCRLIGKYILSIVHRLMQERAHANISECVPVMLYADEFQNLLNKGHDKTLSTMLDEDRKFKLSVNLATTRIGFMNTEMYDAVSSGTAVKICGTMVGRGGQMLASEIGVPADDIKDLPNYTLLMKIGAGTHAPTRIKSMKKPFKNVGRPNPRTPDLLRRKMRQHFGLGFKKQAPIALDCVNEIVDVRIE